MGGSGSNRWGWDYQPKSTVNECNRLEIALYRETIQLIVSSKTGGHLAHFLRWNMNGRPVGEAQLQIKGCGKDLTARLSYTVEIPGRPEENLESLIHLTWTNGLHGQRVCWWVCPECERRCAILYKPPLSKAFACRRCHNLAYPGQQMMDLVTWYKRRFMRDERPAVVPQPWDRYAGYLSETALQERSGLNQEQLAALKAARLLVVDTPDGRYRPKLAGWARKLAELLADGWSVEEIKRWAKERWK